LCFGKEKNSPQKNSLPEGDVINAGENRRKFPRYNGATDTQK
jgi:hypothetical protein